MTAEELSLMRPASLTAIELMNNRFALEEWQQDPKTYCMMHCRVYNDIELYISWVQEEAFKLLQNKLSGE